MSLEDPDRDGLTPAERRLDQLLEPLRRDPPRAEASLVERTVRTARWQQSVRAPLHAIGQIAGAMAEALRLLLGKGGRS